MSGAPPLNRRAFFTGERSEPSQNLYHVSSAVVSVLPGRMSSVVQLISAMPGVEINAHDDHRIVVVIEAGSTGELGGLLTAISALDGVIAANMVFEQIEEWEGREP
jgi:nitrate reductase NapD